MKKDNYISEHKVIEQFEDIKNYANLMISKIHKMNPSLTKEYLLGYYNMILHELDFYKKHYF